MLFRKPLCYIVTSSLVLCAASALIASPKIQFESESLDFGKVVTGNPINATYTFKNVGDSDLEITSVKSGCGCTKAEAKKTKLAPGESSTIEALFNSAGYNGLISKSVAIGTNDPTRGTLSLLLKAEIVALAKFKPERLNFGSIKVNNSRTHLLLVYPADPKTFKITKVDPIGTRVAVPSFKKVTAPTGDYWELFVVVKAGNVPGRMMESLSIVTGPGEKDKVSAMVYGNIIE